MAYTDLYRQPAWRRNPRAALDQYMQQQVQLAQLGAQKSAWQGRMGLQKYGQQMQTQEAEKRLDWFTERSEKTRQHAESMQMQRAQHRYGLQEDQMYHAQRMGEMGELPAWQRYGGIGLQGLGVLTDFASQQQQQEYYRNMKKMQQAQIGYYGGQV